MKIDHGIDNRRHDHRRVPFCKLAPLDNPIKQFPARRKLKDDVVFVLCFERVCHSDDVRMLEQAEDERLPFDHVGLFVCFQEAGQGRANKLAGNIKKRIRI